MKNRSKTKQYTNIKLSLNGDERVDTEWPKQEANQTHYLVLSSRCFGPTSEYTPSRNFGYNPELHALSSVVQTVFGMLNNVPLRSSSS